MRTILVLERPLEGKSLLVFDVHEGKRWVSLSCILSPAVVRGAFLEGYFQSGRLKQELVGYAVIAHIQGHTHRALLTMHVLLACFSLYVPWHQPMEELEEILAIMGRPSSVCVGDHGWFIVARMVWLLGLQHESHSTSSRLIPLLIISPGEWPQEKLGCHILRQEAMLFVQHSLTHLPSSNQSLLKNLLHHMEKAST